jgi:exodeoxyribonuclease VII small subunit
MAKKDLDYRVLSDELDALLTNLQRSDIQVDEAMKLYEQGLGLIKKLEERLGQAENELSTLKAHAAVDNQDN